MASLRESLFGTKGKFKQFETLTPQQRGLIDQLIGGLGGPGGLQQQGLGALGGLLGGGQQFFEQLQAPALRQFEEQTVPGIAERFTGLGAGAQRSSAFAQGLGGAGERLAETLAGQRAGLGLQAQQTGLQGLLSLLGIAQQPQFGAAFQPGREGALGGILGGIGRGVLGGLGGLF
ncbi:MAG: hypothetical protein ACE5GV_00405 [Candidatus Scalindua sp.]